MFNKLTKLMGKFTTLTPKRILGGLFIAASIAMTGCADRPATVSYGPNGELMYRGIIRTPVNIQNPTLQTSIGYNGLAEYYDRIAQEARNAQAYKTEGKVADNNLTAAVNWPLLAQRLTVISIAPYDYSLRQLDAMPADFNGVRYDITGRPLTYSDFGATQAMSKSFNFCYALGAHSVAGESLARLIENDATLGKSMSRTRADVLPADWNDEVAVFTQARSNTDQANFHMGVLHTGYGTSYQIPAYTAISENRYNQVNQRLIREANALFEVINIQNSISNAPQIKISEERGSDLVKQLNDPSWQIGARTPHKDYLRMLMLSTLEQSFAPEVRSTHPTAAAVANEMKTISERASIGLVIMNRNMQSINLLDPYSRTVSRLRDFHRNNPSIIAPPSEYDSSMMGPGY